MIPAGSTLPVRRGLFLLLRIVCLGHALQLFSLLRLNHDAVRLLKMAWSAHTTGSYAVNGAADQYPTGYPAMIRTLLAAGLGSAGWIHALTLAWLFAAAASWFALARRAFGLPVERAVVATTLPLLSWVTIKHASIPLSDVPFLGLSSAALLCLQGFWLGLGGRAWLAWLAALLLAATALQVRTVGIVLVTSVLLCPLLDPRLLDSVRAVCAARRTVGWLGLCGVVAFGVLAALWLRQTAWFDAQFRQPDSYLVQFLEKHRQAGGTGELALLGHRLREITSVMLNYPFARIPLIPAALVAGGTLVALAWMAGRCRRTHLPLILYGVLTLALLALWPYADARFFIPLLPVASLLAVSAFPAEPSRVWTWGRRISLAWLAGYTLLGFAALGHSARQTLLGRDLARNYSVGAYQLTYRHAFGFEPDAAPGDLVADWSWALRTFEPRARISPAATSFPP